MPAEASQDHFKRSSQQQLDNIRRPEQDYSDYKRVEKQFKATDEIEKGEPTGNKLLPKECGFCGFRHHCWKNAKYLPKHTSRAKNPPYVWYTKVAKNAHT